MTHTYAASGSYTVTLTAGDNGGATVSQAQTISVVRVTEPLASFTFSCIELACSFDASGSSDPDGDITRYAWDFGDNTEGVGVTVTHSVRNVRQSYGEARRH